VTEEAHEGGNKLRLQGVHNLLRHHGLGHSGSRKGCDAVGLDVSLRSLECESTGEPEETKLGGGVVGLSEASVESGSRCGVDDSAVLLLLHVRPGGLGAREGPLQMDQHDQVPVLVGHLRETDVSQDPGVVDQDVHPSEGIDGRLDNFVTELDRVVVGNGLTPASLDLIHHGVSSTGVVSVSSGRPSEIVHDHLGAPRGKHKSIGLPEAATGSGDHCNLTVVANSHGEKYEEYEDS